MKPETDRAIVYAKIAESLDLNRWMKKEHREAGLRLQPDGKTLLLQDSTGRNLNYFDIETVTIDEIWSAADQALNWQKSGIEFVPVGRN